MKPSVSYLHCLSVAVPSSPSLYRSLVVRRRERRRQKQTSSGASIIRKTTRRHVYATGKSGNFPLCFILPWLRPCIHLPPSSIARSMFASPQFPSPHNSPHIHTRSSHLHMSQTAGGRGTAATTGINSSPKPCSHFPSYVRPNRDLGGPGSLCRLPSRNGTWPSNVMPVPAVIHIKT